MIFSRAGKQASAWRAWSDSKVAGIGIVIEKSFQPGGRLLREAGYDLHSLVKIKAFTNNQVVFDE